VEAGERLLEIARNGEDTGRLLEAHHTLWPTLVAMGEPKQALPHMERGVALYDRERHGAYASLYGGHDPGACCRYYLALTQWILGYPERALATVYEASRLAETLGHAMTSAQTLWFVTFIQYQRGERPAAVGTAERALSIIETYGFSAWAADTAVLLHAVRADRLDVEALNALHREMTAAPSNSWRRLISGCLLAELYGEADSPARGLQILASLAAADRTGYYGSEVYRLEGELRRRLAPPAAEDAARCFERAIDFARHRETKSLELRATTSLARLWRDQGRREDARRVLADVYGWFTEGFGTQDLRAAKALLDELGR
jgi:tetratricopeptide (TPR) repeat protein